VCLNVNAAELMESMKRCAQTVLYNGGVFRKVENLGERELAHSISRLDPTGKYPYEKYVSLIF
jgi:ribosomal protein S6